MRTARILEEAAEEAAEAIAWYESECPGLGLEFAEAIERAITVIEDDIVPLAPMPLVSARTGARRLVLQRFPYEIVAIVKTRRHHRRSDRSSNSQARVLARASRQA